MTTPSAVQFDSLRPRFIRIDRPEADAMAVLLRATDGANPIDVAASDEGKLEVVVDGISAADSEQVDYTKGEVQASSLSDNTGNWATLIAAPPTDARELVIQNLTQFDISISHTATAGQSTGDGDFVVGRQSSVNHPLWGLGLKETRGAVCRFNGSKTTLVGKVHAHYLHT